MKTYWIAILTLSLDVIEWLALHTCLTPMEQPTSVYFIEAESAPRSSQEVLVEIKVFVPAGIELTFSNR
jgi:hypothetical protein